MLDFIYELNYLTYLCWFLAGMSNGVMDKLQFHYKDSLLDKLDGVNDTFDPDKSWINKYKDFGDSFIANTFEKLRKTALVFTTDLWHLMQWFMLKFFALSFLFYEPSDYLLFEVFFIMFVPFHLGFNLMFYKLLDTKEKATKIKKTFFKISDFKVDNNRLK